MGFVDLFAVATMPVLKVLIVTALGSFLALDSINILGPSTRKQVNNIAYFVFNPALVGSNLASTITYESIILLWFMPVNILITFIIGSALGWVLMMMVKPPQHLKGLVLGTCAAGNLGNMLLIILPAVCKEKGSPFGDPNVCYEYGMAYASVSLADIRTGWIIGRGTESRGLYYVDEVVQDGTALLAHGTTEREAWLWHRRLGHPSTGYLHILFPELFPSNKTITCETCMLAKSHRHPFKHNNTRVNTPFSLIHSDVWGPAPVIGGQNFRYFVLFVDDCTRMTWIYFLKSKSEVVDCFTIFYTMIQTQFKQSIQIVRSDNGGEYVNSQMNLFFQSKGIIHQTTCAHTPEQNGVAERKNRILLEMTRALIIESHVPKSFWPEALATSTYLLNRLPTRILKLKTPLETLEQYTDIPPTLTLKPKVFGCTVFVHIPKTYRDKLDPCAEKCVFVGYGVNQKGYRCYNPKTRRMFTTMNCDFLETKYYYSP